MSGRETLAFDTRHDAAGWLRSCGEEVSPFGEKVADLLGRVYSGIYHVDGVRRNDFSHPRWISVVVRDSGMDTYDGDTLTRIVLLAHEMNVQVRVKAHTHGYLKLQFYTVDRSGFMVDRHPTLDEAVSRLRERGVLQPPAAQGPEAVTG